MNISAIVPVWNGRDLLARLLTTLEAQTRPAAELLIVDDVRVTGAHQRCLVRASDALPLAGRTFVYIASFGTPASGRVDPIQEDVLNHAAVDTVARSMIADAGHGVP